MPYPKKVKEYLESKGWKFVGGGFWQKGFYSINVWRMIELAKRMANNKVEEEKIFWELLKEEVEEINHQIKESKREMGPKDVE